MRVLTDFDAVIALVHEVGAQVHRPSFRQSLAAEAKGRVDVVTRVDREAERLLVDGLARLAPGVTAVGEEAASSDPSLLRALRGDRAVWLVDPLDGTQNFLEGSPDHAIMLALVRAGRPVFAVVHSHSMSARTPLKKAVVLGETTFD